jgi:hypothetical protein
VASPGIEAEWTPIMGGYVAVSGLLYGTTAGTVTPGPYTIPGNTSDYLSVSNQIFLAGNTTVSIPSWAAGMVIVPNPANDSTMIIKGVAGDTGILCAAENVICISFPGAGPQASFVIHVTVDQTTETQIFFF